MTDALEAVPTADEEATPDVTDTVAAGADEGPLPEDDPSVDHEPTTEE